MNENRLSQCLFVRGSPCTVQQAGTKQISQQLQEKPNSLEPFGKGYPQRGAEEALSERVAWSGDQEDDKMMLIAKEMEIVVHSLNY